MSREIWDTIRKYKDNAAFLFMRESGSPLIGRIKQEPQGWVYFELESERFPLQRGDVLMISYHDSLGTTFKEIYI